MGVLALGHVNLWVSRLDASAMFYGEVLGFREVARGELKSRRVAFYSLGRPSQSRLGRDRRRPGSKEGREVGLNHIGLKIGDSLHELRLMRDRLVNFGVPVIRLVDHRVCLSLHVQDPDGVVIELYADGDPNVWKREPNALMYSETLEIRPIGGVRHVRCKEQSDSDSGCCRFRLRLHSTGSGAETYPVKPIHLIVPSGPGAGIDSRAREVANKLSEVLGQPVIVENRPGAGGIIAIGGAAKAVADGYTLAFSSIFPLVYFPALYRKLPYAPHDLVPVSLLATGPSSVYASPSFPANTVQELLELAKAKPGSITFGSQGHGSFQHLAGEWFKSAAQVDLLHIPYKDYSQILTDLMAGRVSLLFDSTGAVLPQVLAGKLKAMAVTGAKRLANLPEVPTFSEAGLSDYEPGVNYGIFAPAGTPQPVIDALALACARVQKSKEIQDSIARIGFTSVGSTPAELAGFMAKEQGSWIKVVKATGLQLDY